MWVGVGAGVWPDAGKSLRPHGHKDVLPIKNPMNQQGQRTKTSNNGKASTFWAVSSVRGTFSSGGWVLIANLPRVVIFALLIV